jgi:hypothetical protein
MFAAQPGRHGRGMDCLREADAEADEVAHGGIHCEDAACERPIGEPDDPVIHVYL